jgi:hypothetical protein
MVGVSGDIGHLSPESVILLTLTVRFRVSCFPVARWRLEWVQACAPETRNSMVAIKLQVVGTGIP